MIIDDIKVGNIVRVSQLQSIYNTHIFLENCRTVDRGLDTEGRIAYICNEVSAESDKILLSLKSTYCFYKDEIEDDTNVVFIG